MRRYTLGLGAVLAGVVLSAGLAAKAAIIMQGAGANYVAFEAEGTGVISGDSSTTWLQVSDTEASDGLALEAQSDITTSLDLATYQIQFSNTTQRTYHLYVHMRAALHDGYGYHSSGNNVTYHDGFRVPNDLSDPDPSDSHTTEVMRLPSNVSDENYHWIVKMADYVVPAGLKGTFFLKTQEGGCVIDRFVLSTQSLSDSALSNLANSATLVPEPSSMAGVLLMMAGQFRRRRRG